MKTSEGRKPPTFQRKNANGKNDTRPILWTDERILSELESMTDDLLADKRTKTAGSRTIKTGYEYLYVGQLTAPRGIHKNLWAEWRTKYGSKPDNPELVNIYQKISGLLEGIESLLEARSWEGGMKGELNPTMTKLHLSHKYGVKEKVEIEETGLSKVLRELIDRSEKA